MLKRFICISGCATLLMALLFIYNNFLFKSWNSSSLYQQSFVNSVFQIDLSDWIVSKKTNPGQEYKKLKLSFPITFSRLGCEFIYSVAVLNYPDLKKMNTESYFQEPRYLLRYEYDLKNKRCESKDLSFLRGDSPTSLSIQFIRLKVSDESVKEIPESSGLKIDFSPEDLKIKDLRLDPILQKYPFLSEKTTVRNSKFSVTELKNPVRAIFTPYQDLSLFITEEFDRRIEKCRQGAGCDRITISVSKISDPRIIEKISLAKSTGMEIDWIANGSFRELKDNNKSKAIPISPLFWLKGSLIDGPFEGYLPMHTKFIVFGDDLVISNSTNYDLDKARGSKQAALVYRDRQIAAIFLEIFNITKTNLFYPLKIDLNDSAIILFHAERSRRYTIMSKRPFLQIVSEQGVNSSGYGIALELLRRSVNPSWLSMAPMSNGCYEYDRRLCFFDIIKEKSRFGLIHSSLNAFFYARHDLFTKTRAEGGLFTSSTLSGNLSYFKENLKIILAAFSDTPDNLKLIIGPTWAGSNLHFRSALIDKKFVVNGSGNWAYPHSLNTVEIIKDQLLYDKFLVEISSHSSPYFIINDSLKIRSFGRFESCEFVFEKNFFDNKNRVYPEFNFTFDEIKKEMAEKYSIEINSSWEYVQPDLIREAFEKSENYFGMNFKRLPVRSLNQSYSPYFCMLKPGSTDTFVVQLPNAKDSLYRTLKN